MQSRKSSLVISIDYATCTGCASCQVLCPDIFELREDGKCWVLKDIIDGTPEEIEKITADLKEAISTCPVSCITYRILEG